MPQFISFTDMHSGGRQKEPFDVLIIECGSEEEACSIFYSRFGHSPRRVTCTCCGQDYSIWEHADRGELEKYLGGWEIYREREVLEITAEEIKPHEREVEVPAQGYVWVD